MSAVTSCPRCSRQVSLPAGEDRSAWVRCPHCGAQYPLQTAIDFVPPTLEIVPAPALGAMEEPPPHENAAAAAAFKSAGMFGAGISDHVDASQESAPSEVFQSTVDEIPTLDLHSAHDHATHDHGAHDHAADDFGAAIGLDDQLHSSDEEDVPFVADGEPSHEPGDYAEHVEAADDDEFHFADEHPIGAAEFSEAGDASHETHGGEPHALSGIETMAASPPKTKRRVPLTVRLLGIGIFFGVGAVGCVIVYSAFLYFGVSDLFGIKDYFPKWVVAESLRQKQGPSKNTRNPDADVKSLANGQNANTPDTKQPNSGSAGPSDKPTVADNVTPPSANPDAKGPQKSGAADVAAPSPAKGDPAANPFDNPKPGDANLAKDDPAKVDPLAPAAKLPSLDVPDVKPSGKKADDAAKPSIDKPSDKPTADKPAVDKQPDSPFDKPLDKPNEKSADIPIEKAAEAIAPKSDVSFSLDDLTAAADAASRSTAAFAEAAKTADEAKLKAARIANYRAMSHLATVLTFVKAPDAKSADDFETVKAQIAMSLAAASAATSPAERDVIGRFASVGIHSPSRKESGLFAAGTLKKTEARGRLFESQIELPGGAAPLTVVTAQKPAAEDGSPILLLGAIVNEPAKNLSVYEGTADMVIFGEVLVVPAKTDSQTPPADAAK
jgi:hypothetical protein